MKQKHGLLSESFGRDWNIVFKQQVDILFPNRKVADGDYGIGFSFFSSPFCSHYLWGR